MQPEACDVRWPSGTTQEIEVAQEQRDHGIRQRADGGELPAELPEAAAHLLALRRNDSRRGPHWRAEREYEAKNEDEREQRQRPEVRRNHREQARGDVDAQRLNYRMAHRRSPPDATLLARAWLDSGRSVCHHTHAGIWCVLAHEPVLLTFSGRGEKALSSLKLHREQSPSL